MKFYFKKALTLSCNLLNYILITHYYIISMIDTDVKSYIKFNYKYTTNDDYNKHTKS